MASYTIGNGTRNYTSIQAWDDAAPATLTELWEGLLYKEGGGTDGEWVLSSDSPNYAIVIGGSTATSSFYKRLACASGQSFRNNANKNTNALRYNPSNGVAVRWSGGSYGSGIQINEAYAEVDGVQFNHNQYNGACVRVSKGTIRNSIVHAQSGVGSSFGSGVVYLEGTSGAGNEARLINSLVSTSISANVGVSSGPSGSSYGIIESCTIIKPSDVTAGGNGVSRGYGTTIARNCLILGNWSNASSGTFDAASGYNGTDKSSVAGSSNQVNLTAANQVQDLSTSSALDARLKSGNGVNTAGNRQQALTGDVDILGNARSTTVPAIGAIGEISGGSSINLSMVERNSITRGLNRGLS
jgi:hypothetical protein